MSSNNRLADQKAKDETAVLDAIAAMQKPDKAISERLHAIIKANAPDLWARTWYGMPAYTNGSRIVLWFRSKKKFGERYMTIGFNDVAKLDEGNLWPISYALTKITDVEEAKIAALVKKAVN